MAIDWNFGFRFVLSALFDIKTKINVSRHLFFLVCPIARPPHGLI